MVERFQTDILKLEQHYQHEVKALSEKQVEQKHHWEAQIQLALANGMEQRRQMQEAMEQERESQKEEWTKDRGELEAKVEELVMKNNLLQIELDEFASMAQNKEIELSRQLNDLYNRLQESLETKDELLAQSENKVLQTELLLSQTVEDFQQEKEELEAKYNEMLQISERQIAERIDLLTERDDLKIKIEELELLLKQAALEAELEKNQLQNRESTSKSLQSTEPEMMWASNKEVKNSSECVSFSEEMETYETLEICPNISEEHVISNCANPKIIIDQHEYGDTSDDPVYDGPEMKVTDNNTHPEITDGCKIQHWHEVSGNPSVDPALNLETTKNKEESVSLFLQAGEGVVTHGNNTALESCEEDNKPQDVTARDDGQCHGTVAGPAGPEETGDLGELCLVVYSSPESSHDHEAESLSDSDWERLNAQDCLEHLDDDDHCSLFKLQALYNTAMEENLLLQERIVLLQQKAEILENLLAHNSEKIKTNHQVLEENYTLKVKMLLVMEHVRELETKALKMTELQIRYEDCMCENAKLSDQNDELERRVWSLEGTMNIFPDFRDLRVSCVDEVDSLRDKNTKLLELICELERQGDVVSDVHAGDESLDISSPPATTVHLESGLGDSCVEFERHNGKLRRAITELQDKTQTVNETTEAHR